MSIRLEMLQVARLAPNILGDSVELVSEFIRSQFNDDGGVASRSGVSDLYYTVFGLDCLNAIQEPIDKDRLKSYLKNFGHGEGLDFVHLCCLTHCWSVMEDESFYTSELCEKIFNELRRYRSDDGGFHPTPNSKCGTAYAGFLGFSAHKNLRQELRDPLNLVRSLKFLECESGGWANERGISLGATNSSAAAVTLLRNLNVPINQDVSEFFLSHFHQQGGFLAMEFAPMPDLLSTATALHALTGIQYDVKPISEKCLDFIDSLWTNKGSFHGNWADDHLDCEYTFYGLLSLGHLSIYT